MKRPLALIGLTSMLVLTVCFYASSQLVKVVFVLALAGLIASLAVKKLRKALSPSVFFATVLLTVVGFNIFSQFYVTPIQHKYSGETHTVVGSLCDEGTCSSNRCFYEIQVEYIDGEAVDLKMMLKSKEAIMFKVGDRIGFNAFVDEEHYGKYLSNKCYLSASVIDDTGIIIEKAEQRPLYYYAVELRDKLRTAFYLELKFDNAALATAVLLGDNSGFSEDISENLRRAGLSHITVVSGLHLSMIMMAYYKLFGRLFKNKYVNAFVTLLLVFFFLCLTGFGKSSIRAALMLFILILSKLFNREGDSVNSLGLAAIVLCAFNPFVVGDVGVLLSFSATFGIVAFSTPLEKFLTKRLSPVTKSRHRFINKSLRKIAALFSVTFTAVLATLPVTIIFFGNVSLVQIVSNLVVVPFVQYFMIAAVFTVVLHFIPYIGVLTGIAAFATDVIGKIMLCLTDFFASLPMAYVRADYDFVFFWLFASIGLFLLIHILRRKGRGLKFICGMLSLLILTVGSVGHVLAYKDTLTLQVAPSYGGQSVILSSKDGNAVLCCSGKVSGSGYIINILDTLQSEGSLMVVASSDNSASENAENILSLFDYDKILMYDTSDSSEHADFVKASDSDVTEVEGDFTANLWDKVTLSITEREGCVYQYLSAQSATVLILPEDGDALHVPEEMRNPDVLITSGIISNMELLSFETLISNGSSFQQAAVVDFYRLREGEKLTVTDTITFDIVG